MKLRPAPGPAPDESVEGQHMSGFANGHRAPAYEERVHCLVIAFEPVP
jgi:hypothetical protein